MGPVRWMAVDHEKDRLAAPPQERLEEGPEGAGVQPASEDLVPEGPQRAHRGDCVHCLPLATGRHNGRLPARSSGPAQWGIRADPGLVEEKEEMLKLSPEGEDFNPPKVGQ